MSHSSGILVSDELRNEFASAKWRALFIQVSDASEQLQLQHSLPLSSPLSEWQEDYRQISQFITSDKDPYFIVFQLGDKSFLLISYIPDEAPVRKKMLYSSSKAFLTKQLGDSLFTDQMHVNLLKDLSLDSYLHHCDSKNASAPLTQRELELSQLKRADSQNGVSVSTKQTFNNALNLAIENQSLLSEFVSDSITPHACLEFSIIPNTETFTIRSWSSVSELFSVIPHDSPRFALIKVLIDNASIKTIFLYTCPSKSPIRDRMLYSASRAHILAKIVESSVKVDAKFELSEMSELSEDWLKRECGFVESSTSPASDLPSSKGFVKKTLKGPGGGPRRLH